MATTTETRWFTGSNGNRFFDWGGWRYCVAYRAPGQYAATRNGVSLGNDWDHFDNLTEAQTFVEKQSGYRT